MEYAMVQWGPTRPQGTCGAAAAERGTPMPSANEARGRAYLFLFRSSLTSSIVLSSCISLEIFGRFCGSSGFCRLRDSGPRNGRLPSDSVLVGAVFVASGAPLTGAVLVSAVL